MSETPIEVDQIWHKIDGTSTVRIGRVWGSGSFCGGGTFVRCHPTKGGKVWFALIEDFIKRYEIQQ